MQTNAPDRRPLEPAILGQFRAQGIKTAQFAYFENHDEWQLEDIRVTYQNGEIIEAPYSDTPEPDLCALLEQIGFDGGYVLVEVDIGTVTQLDEAFLLELRWWQLDEATQQALEDAGEV